MNEHMNERILFTIGLAVMLILSIPFYALASTTDNTDDSDTELVRSKSITHTEVYNGNVDPPPRYYNYDSGAWHGTLELARYKYDGIETKATYKGTVYCTDDVCPLGEDGGAYN